MGKKSIPLQTNKQTILREFIMKTNSIRLFSVTSLVLAMSACSTIPPKAPEMVLAEPNLPLSEPYDVVDNISTISKPSTNETQTTETNNKENTPNLASIRWEDFYSDEKLKALIELGLEHSKTFELKKISVETLATKYQITDIANLPKLGSSAGYERSGVSNGGSKGAYSVGLGLSEYEIDFWGKIANQKEVALQDYLKTNADKDAHQITLISSIAQSYANISYAKAQVILAESTVKTREQSLFITQKRFEAGVDSKSPLLTAESSLASAHLSLIEAKSKLEKAINALQLLIGTPVPEGLLPEPALTSLVALEVLNTGLPSDLLFYRPDIVAAEHELKSTGADINIARASFFPSVKLSLGSIGFSGGTLSEVFKDGVFGWKGVGVGVDLPLFDLGTRRANYKNTVLAQNSALASYEHAIQSAFKEVRDILIERNTLEDRLALQYRLQDISQERYNIAFATYRSGISDYLNVLTAEEALFGAQQSILAIELEKLISQIDLYRALGGGATLVAEQIAPADTQKSAMTAARLANEQEVATLSKNPPKKTNDSNVDITETSMVEAEATQEAEPATKTPAETPKKSKLLDNLKEKFKSKKAETSTADTVLADETSVVDVANDITPATAETTSSSDGN